MNLATTVRTVWIKQRNAVPPSAKRALRTADGLAALVAFAVIAAHAHAIYFPSADASAPQGRAQSGLKSDSAGSGGFTLTGRDALAAAYVGIPDHYRSDVHIKRPDGTDLTMKNLHWEGEPFHFPLYAGVRYVSWRGNVGGMIDFLHDKAVSRVGKGAHGRRLKGPLTVPETLEMEGTLKGMPAPKSAKITDVVERLEFSHGHNMLLPTFLMRLGKLAPQLSLYGGLGAGVALPHVEIWPAGEGEAAKTNEYQLAGPAGQFVVGLEWQGAYGSLFLEYKFTLASLATSMTGGKTPSWCNCDIVSDFGRHIWNWWNGVTPAYGSLSTTLSGHQIVGGIGYRPGSIVRTKTP